MASAPSPEASIIPYTRRRPLLPSPAPTRQKPLVPYKRRPRLHSPPSAAPATLLPHCPTSPPASALPDEVKKTRGSVDVSRCFSCRRHFPISRRRRSLVVYRSLWRIVLLCKDCLGRIRSAEFCSYCFSSITGSGASLCCRRCSCRIHVNCVRCEHRFTSIPKIDGNNFVCVDCCPIPSFLVTKSDFLGDRLSGVEVVREAEQKVAVASARGGCSENNALVDKQDSNQAGGSQGMPMFHEGKVNNIETKILADDEFAKQLHYAMNGSQRKLRSRGSEGSGDLLLEAKDERIKNDDVRVCVENKACVDVIERCTVSADFSLALGCASSGVLEWYGNTGSQSETVSAEQNEELTATSGELISEDNALDGDSDKLSEEGHAEGNDRCFKLLGVSANWEEDFAGTEIALKGNSDVHAQSSTPDRYMKKYSRRGSKYMKV